MVLALPTWAADSCTVLAPDGFVPAEQMPVLDTEGGFRLPLIIAARPIPRTSIGSRQTAAVSSSHLRACGDGTSGMSLLPGWKAADGVMPVRRPGEGASIRTALLQQSNDDDSKLQTETWSTTADQIARPVPVRVSCSVGKGAEDVRSCSGGSRRAGHHPGGAARLARQVR